VKALDLAGLALPLALSALDVVAFVLALACGLLAMVTPWWAD
jgi:hypothetical protein